ncbi:MAG: GbsR/MarR family transcriptional regulator [Akkermansiaceae bacterium]
MSSTSDSSDRVQSIDDRLISFFQDGVSLLGLPKSVGEIYGFLYLSEKPLTMLDLVTDLKMSKGSASQGLKLLRTLGAIHVISFENDRKTYFEANVELKKLVGGFIRQEIRPHLKSGKNKLAELKKDIDVMDDPEMKEFYYERIDRLERWSSKTNFVLPLLQKILGE